MLRLLRSAAVGLVGAAGLGVLAFALARWFDAVRIYILPVWIVGPLVGPLIPTRIVYWLVPEGGAPAGLLFIMFCALLFWAVLFGGIHFAWSSVKRRRFRMQSRNLS